MTPPRLVTAAVLAALLPSVVSAESVSGAARARRVVFWLEPYANLTSVPAYVDAWHQWRDNARPGYVMAGSAYAVKPNGARVRCEPRPTHTGEGRAARVCVCLSQVLTRSGSVAESAPPVAATPAPIACRLPRSRNTAAGSLGYADTSAGEGENGILMERYGFPALKALNLTTIAMVYLTHNAAIAKVLADPAPLIAQLLAKAKETGIDGWDVDYEPQAEDPAAPASAVSLMAFLTTLAQAMTDAGLLLTIDIGGCPAFHDFMCSGVAGIPGLTQVNTMDSFGVRIAADLQRLQRVNQPALAARWAPGFEPGGVGEAGLRSVLSYAATANVTALSTWAVHEANVGDQPQWLFDAVNAWVDAP